MNDEQSRRRAEELRSSRRSNLNQMANDAAQAVGLDYEQKERFHRYLTSLGNDDLTYQELVEIARQFKS